MLAYYSWDTDEQQLVPKKDVPSTLARLAQSCPADQPETATRLKLKSLAAESSAKDAKPRANPTAVGQVTSVLADGARARANFDLPPTTRGRIAGNVTLPESPERSNSSTRGMPRSVCLPPTRRCPRRTG